MKTNDSYKGLYNKVGKKIGWDFSRVKSTEEGQGWDFYQEVQKKVKPDDVILDIGTGGGEKILKIASHFKSVFGIDHSQSMINTANKNLNKRKLDNVTFSLMDSSSLNFPNDYFDIITDRHCDFSAREVYKVLKKSGYFMTQQVSEDDQINTKKAFERGQSYGVKDGTLKDKYLRELKEAGFRNVKSFEYNSDIYYKTDEDYLFILYNTPTIPNFGNESKDFEIFKNFVKKNKTEKGIKTNSKRFMIIAQK